MNNPLDNNSLFSDFQPVTTAEWIKKAVEDIKGTPFEKLSWKVSDKLELKPFYREEDIDSLAYLNTKSGIFPYTSINKKNLNDWIIRQDIRVTDINTANSSALHALENGANALCFEFDEKITLQNHDLKKLLDKISVDKLSLYFIAPGNEEKIIGFLSEEALLHNIDPCMIRGAVYFDPLAHLAATGTFYKSAGQDFTKSSQLVRQTSEKLPNFRTITINGNVFHNAGGNAIQELAFGLSCASEYMERLSEKNIPVDTIANSFHLDMSVGPLYFIEIAKFRAARLLFTNMINAWNPADSKSSDIFIHATTSEWNQTVFDPYMNILRGTTEAMAAVLGSADSLTVLPLGKSSGSPAEPGLRIARNTQNILKEEANFNKVIDPASGSYYIEKITGSLAEQAWDLFLETENKGGFSSALKSGWIQNIIKETAGKRNTNIATRREILTGTNQYPDPPEKPNSGFDASVAFPAGSPSVKPVSEPLLKYRGAMEFEKLRIRTLSNNTPVPKVFLLNYGNPKWFTARAAFAANFFGCAGYEIIQQHPFNTIKEGVETALSTNASIIVLCSSDDQYPSVAPEARKLTGDRSILVVAGFPKDCIDSLKEQGIEHFIHLNSNILDELNKFHALLGIK